MTGREVATLTGRKVKLTFEGDPSYGRTLRWGTLREARAGVAVIDGFEDCNGVKGQYPEHRADGVEVTVSSIVAVCAA